MKPIEFVGQTHIFAPPIKTPHGVCGGLPLRDVVDHSFVRNGMRYDSMWMPSAEELKALNEGAAVRLCVYGIQPAVWIDTEHVEALP